MSNTISGWAIICDATRGAALGVTHMALVDKVAYPDSDWWTTDDPARIVHFRYEHVALRNVARFKTRNARVVSYEDAFNLIRFQNDQIHARTHDRLAGNPTT